MDHGLSNHSGCLGHRECTGHHDSPVSPLPPLPTKCKCCGTISSWVDLRVALPPRPTGRSSQIRQTAKVDGLELGHTVMIAYLHMALSHLPAQSDSCCNQACTSQRAGLGAPRNDVCTCKVATCCLQSPYA